VWHIIEVVNDLLSVPIWLVALVAAAAAPSCVRFLAARIERRARDRTAETIARADEMVESCATMPVRASRHTEGAESGGG
jgi:hypothetical protein